MFKTTITVTTCLASSFKRLVLFKEARKLSIPQFVCTMGSIAKIYDNNSIVKSNADPRQYRGLELTNGMKILLVSDPDTDKSSAAMDIHVGHLKDPQDLPGLAHFCEHMLFLGTKKYPEENEYNKFLNEHGGMSNAYTSLEHTNYYFDVSPDQLTGALDRFAQFFQHPLFTASATEREVNAVDSENSRNLQSDPWRLFQLDKSMARPGHDYSKFGTGNKETLDTIPRSKGQDVREELLKFHDKFYSSNIMGCCVLGRESLDELQAMVVPHLETVLNKSVDIPRWDEPPYTEDQLQHMVYAVPVKDIREMSVMWPTPDLSEHYMANPGHYLGHLLGHEGKGSLLSELKSRGWANTLVGGQRSGAKGFSFFSIAVDLTDKGQENTDEIITLIYQHINMLKREGPKEWIFNECKDLASMSFHFKDKESPRMYTSGLAGKLQEFPMEDTLSAYSLFEKFDPELISLIVDKLTPSNMRAAIVSKKFEQKTDKVEKWYGTQYKVEKFTPQQIKKWTECGFHENLSLPAKNEFIPTNFDLVPRDSEAGALPEIIKNTTFLRLWHKQDDKFLKPKACINLDIISPIAYMDPLHTNLNTLFTMLFEDALTEYSYMAEIAGLKYSLDSSIYGLSLTVKGYNDKLVTLLTKIVEKMATFQADPERLHIFKEIHSRNLKNFHAEQPHQHAIFYTNMLTSEVLWTKEELLDVLDEVTLEKLQSFVSEMLSKLYVEGLIYGNINKAQSLKMVELVQDILAKHKETKPLLPSQHRRIREVQLPDGYIVFSGVRRSKGVQGLRVIVQSSKPPQFVEGRIEAFIQKMNDTIQEMSQEEFNKHVNALATRRLEKPKKLMQQNNKYWTEIVSSFYNFDRDAVEVAFLKTLTKEDLLQFYQEKICLTAPKRHKLSVQVMSDVGQDSRSPSPSPGVQTEASAGDKDGMLPTPVLPQPIVVTDVMEFKRDLALYPLPKPFVDLTKAKL